MVFKVSDAQNLSKEFGLERRKFYESDKAIVAQIVLEPGTHLKKHGSEEFALIYLISGRDLKEGSSTNLIRPSLLKLFLNLVRI